MHATEIYITDAIAFIKSNAVNYLVANKHFAHVNIVRYNRSGVLAFQPAGRVAVGDAQNAISLHVRNRTNTDATRS